MEPQVQSKGSTRRGVDLDHRLVRHLAALRAFVRHRVGERLRDRESSGDLVQSVCRELLAHRSRFSGSDGQFQRWLYVTAHRKILQRDRHWRTQQRDVAREVSGSAGVSNTNASPSRAAVRAEDVRRLRSALARLPASYREVIVLSRYAGLTHAGIAERMGRSEGSVRMLITRALAHLVVKLGQEPG